MRVLQYSHSETPKLWLFHTTTGCPFTYSDCDCHSRIAATSLLNCSQSNPSAMSQSQSQLQTLYVTVQDRTHTFNFRAISQRHHSGVAITRCKRTLMNASNLGHHCDTDSNQRFVRNVVVGVENALRVVRLYCVIQCFLSIGSRCGCSGIGKRNVTCECALSLAMCPARRLL